MTQLYLRKVSITVADASGNALDVSNLRCKFIVKQHTLQNPNTCDLRIYNLSASTLNRIKVGGEFTRVRMTAGYDGQYGLIFDGSIVQTKNGRESKVDTFLDVIAADGDQAYNFATVNGTLAAGHTAEDHLKMVIDSMRPHGVTAGYLPPLTSPPSPRGRVVYGMCRDELQRIATNNQCTWSIQNGAVTMLGNKAVLPGAAIVLTSKTGMLGLPIQTTEGILIRCLLNPNLLVGGAVKIDNKSVQQARIDTSLTGGPQNAFLPSIKNDGFYRMVVVEHSGDTRGTNFYSELVCIGIDAPTTPALVSKGLT